MHHKYNMTHKYNMNNLLFMSMQRINAILKTQPVNTMWFRAAFSPAPYDILQFESFICKSYLSILHFSIW